MFMGAIRNLCLLCTGLLKLCKRRLSRPYTSIRRGCVGKPPDILYQYVFHEWSARTVYTSIPVICVAVLRHLQNRQSAYCILITVKGITPAVTTIYVSVMLVSPLAPACLEDQVCITLPLSPTAGLPSSATRVRLLGFSEPVRSLIIYHSGGRAPRLRC